MNHTKDSIRGNFVYVMLILSSVLYGYHHPVSHEDAINHALENAQKFFHKALEPLDRRP